MKQFIYIRKNEEPSRTVGLARVMVAARLRLRSGTVSYRFRVNDDPTGPENRRGIVLRKLRWHALHGDVGDVYRVYASPGDGARFRVHRVRDSVEIIDIGGNHNSDVYYSTILSVFPEYHPRYAGSYVCKDVAGTGTMSQHSYGNAVDFFFDTLTHQDAVADWVVANAGDLSIQNLISRQRIWNPQEGWHAYSGDYHSHLHADFNPQFSGPCGVREP